MWHPVKIEEISALLIAYQRPDNIEMILSKVVDAGIKDIFVSLDYPRFPDSDSLHRREEIIRVVERFAANPNLSIRISAFSRNVGCGVAVTTACDWFFDSVNLGVVLEDDCIPSSGFFSYMQFALAGLNFIDDLYIASGSRLHPYPTIGVEWELNCSPVFWGWGSSSNKWKFLSTEIKLPLPRIRKYPSPLTIPSFYWRAGSRRVREGFVDTWDTLISELFHRLNLRNLSPSRSLVQNIGDDEYATHEMSYLPTLPVASEIFDAPNSVPIFSSADSAECGIFLYKYRARHIVTTSLTKVLDRTIRTHQSSNPFVYRLVDGFDHYTELRVGQ